MRSYGGSKMKLQFISFIFISLFTTSLLAIEIIAPKDYQRSNIQINDPDQHIKTLGRVAFQIDLSAAHDDLLALKVRRSSLTLKNSRPFTAFGVHKKAGIIVLAGGDVTHVSIANIEDKQGIKNALVLFYGKGNKVISPHPNDVAVFNADFKSLNFTYTPLQTPRDLKIPVSIALDISGSMDGHMSAVLAATKSFMLELPESTQCRLYTFNDDVISLMPLAIHQRTSCASSAYLLNRPMQASGATALYKAIHTGFEFDIFRSFPNITIVVTDGVNTVDNGHSLSSLKFRKDLTNGCD